MSHAASKQELIRRARAHLDVACQRVERYVAKREVLKDAATVPPEELRQLNEDIDRCRQMIDTISEVVHA